MARFVAIRVLSCALTFSLATACKSVGACLASPTAFVQAFVHVHDARSEEVESDEENAGVLDAIETMQGFEYEEEQDPTQYLVDNSVLQHKGPGVLYRNSKDLNDTAGKRYAAWGSMVSGINTGDGWLKVEDRFLPTTVRGVPVVTPQEPIKPRMRIVYRSTEVRAPDGAWIACTITGRGSRPDTYNIRVNPTAFASYSAPNVPSSLLKRIVRLREPMPATPQMAAAKKIRKVPTGFIYLKVNDSQGHIIEMKLLKRSPMRALMHVACNHLKLSQWTCESKSRFIINGRQIYPTDFPDILGLKDGDTVELQRGARPEAPKPVQ